jgi:opacity protein-like surface antigen
MRKFVVLLTSLLLIIGVAAGASAQSGVMGLDYTPSTSSVVGYGSMALTDKIKVGVEYSGLLSGTGDFRADILYQATGSGRSSLDVGAGVALTTPISAFLVLQGTTYFTDQLVLHTSIAYKVTPAPTALSWSAGVGYDISESVFAKVSYSDGAIAVGVGFRF